MLRFVGARQAQKTGMLPLVIQMCLYWIAERMQNRDSDSAARMKPK